MLISQVPQCSQNNKSMLLCSKVTFTGNYERNMAESVKVLAKIKDRAIESYNNIHPGEQGLKYEQREFTALKVVYLKRKLDAIRKYVFNYPVSSPQERSKIWAKKVMKYGVGNCGDMAEVVTELFSKSGVDSFHARLCKFVEGVDLTGQSCLINEIDHGMVVVTDEKFSNAIIPLRVLMKMKDIIIVDAWLGKIFKSVPEAFEEYNKLFGLELQDCISKVASYFRDIHAHLSQAQRAVKRQKCERNLRSEIKDIEDWYAEIKNRFVR